MNEKDKSWGEIAGKLFCILCIGVGAYLVFKYAFIIFMPFIIAWGLALFTSPIAKRLSDRLRISKKLAAFIITSVFIGVICFSIYLVTDRLVYESERLLLRLSSDSDRLGSAVANLFDRFSSFGDKRIKLIENLMKFEPFRQFWDNIDVAVSDAVKDTVGSVTKKIPSMLFNILGKMPQLMLFIFITLISCFYFAADIDRINRVAVSKLPQKWRDRMPVLKKKFLIKSGRYVRAYVLLLLLTFGELLVGFFILGVPYPFLLALSIAVLDILTILGVGTALIPWALIEVLLFRNYFIGIGLFIVYVIITLVRQVTEPRIVAGSLGLHPLLTLISMYVGLKLFGIFGMLLGPALLTVLGALKGESKVDN